MAKYHLHMWSVSIIPDYYLAPEQNRVSLLGFRDDENKRVITSPIASANGREITTKSGSIYILEDIDPMYSKWMELNGIEYDPIHPIKIKKVNGKAD